MKFNRFLFNLFHFSVSIWLVVLSVSSVVAQQPIIVIEGSQKVAVAVEKTSGPNADVTRRVLENDFRMNSRTEIVKIEQALFTVSVVDHANGITGTLKDEKGKKLFSENFADDWRRATHRFVDKVILTITGAPGIASTRVTFVSAHTGNKEIYIMDIDGANVRQLTNDKSISLGPKFSPSAESIAYTSYKSGYPDVWVIDLINKRRRSVSFYPGINTAPAFSPDGFKLAVTLSKDGNTELYTINANGGSPTRLTKTRGVEASPTWSPKGNEIAYISDDRGTPQIMIINSDTRAVRRFRTNSTYTTEPQWSPDGKKFVYSIRTAGQSQIGVSEIATTQQKILTTSGLCESPSWCRDSRHIIFSRRGRLYLLDSVSGEDTAININLNHCTEPYSSK
ncbi:MAG: biopolymer transporter Tol [Verrucomicrobiota bacterium]